jgi:hypothetical protein
MTDELDDKALDKRIAALINGHSRRRGRPPMGFTKAMQYTKEVWELRRAGMPSWRSVVEVARRNRKRPEHISACVKIVTDTPPHEYGPDRPEEAE